MKGRKWLFVSSIDDQGERVGTPGNRDTNKPRPWLATVCLALTVVVFLYALFVSLLPTFAGEYADRRFLLCLLSVLLIVLYWLTADEPLRVAGWHALWWAVVALLAYWGQTPASDSPFYWVEPVYYAFYFSAIVCWANLIHKGRSLTVLGREISTSGMLFLIMGGACFFYAGLSLQIYVFALLDGFSRLDAILPHGFVNIRYWSHTASWLLWLLPLAVLATPLRNQRLWRLMIALAAAVWWWLLFLSMSRGSVIGLLIGYVAALAVFGRAAYGWAWQGAKYACYGGLAWLLLSFLIPGLFFDAVDIRAFKVDSSGRWPLWLEALTMSFERFPLGMGAQAWITHEPLLEPYYQNAVSFAHPHNMYLMGLAEYGWLLLLPMLFAVWHCVQRVWRCRQLEVVTGLPEQPLETKGAVSAGLFSAVVAALVHAGGSAVFIAPSSMLIGLCVLSLFWAHFGVRPAGGTHLASQSLRLLLILLLLLFSGGWLREVYCYYSAMKEQVASQGAVRMMPRFWLNGRFPSHDD